MGSARATLPPRITHRMHRTTIPISSSGFRSRCRHRETFGARSTPSTGRKNVVNLILDAVEARVLGCLIEKEITTPEYYPLSLNALVAACNQTSNRNPVVHYDEVTVAGALDTLREKK